MFQQQVTIDNFHISTHGTFVEIKSIPQGFIKFFSSPSQKSHYYCNEAKTILVRVSDHWGYKIRQCSWMLRRYKHLSSFKWKEFYGAELKIGIIKISKLAVKE
jgi:hypothetical protein